MPKVILTFKEQEIKEYPFENDSITIGRNKDNDLVIDNLAVSGFHARIDKVGRDYILTDLKSLNGVFVNEEKIISHTLKSNDKIIIGKHALVFLIEDGDEKEKRAPLMSNTMYIDTKEARELRKKVERGGTMAMQPKSKLPKGVITFLEGGRGELELSKKITTIGKDSSCDIVVSGMLVASMAATITIQTESYSINFIKGMAKLKVNGSTVKGTQILKEFDTIEIGSVKMQFYFK